MKEIKNIIFDLGGVIINLDYQRTRNAFQALGIADFDRIFTQTKQTGFFDAFDKGLITPDEFRAEVRKHIPQAVNDAQIDEAWDAMLLDVPYENLDVLSNLKPRYRTFLLSNTNEIHVRNFSAYLDRTYGTPDFGPYFEQWYYSCRIGKRKPDAEAFEFVLAENNLIPEETLFIDDTMIHIEGAKKLSIRVEHFTATTLPDLIKRLQL